MKYISSIKTYTLLPVILIMILVSPVWGAAGEKSAGDPPEYGSPYILSHNEITNSGARNLEDLLTRIPGVRISFNNSQSRPTASPLVSSDSATRLSASHFSRVLIMFNGHPLNKNWHGGADQEWDTGFLEGLKEIRVYTGPAAINQNGGAGAVDMIIDLIPFNGADQNGVTNFRLSQSLNTDRADKTLVHLRTGSKWGTDGHYSVFADFTQWAGEDVSEYNRYIFPAESGTRLDRKDPTFQVGTVLKNKGFNLMARHLRHYLFDPDHCGRKWSYTFIEGIQTVEFPAQWQTSFTGSADHIVSEWGAASSKTGEITDDWDRVKELRLTLRLQLERKMKNTSIFVGADFQHVRADGEPVRDGDMYSVMNFTTRRNTGGVYLRLTQRITDSLWLRGGFRAEKAEGYSNTAFLPEIALLYKQGNTSLGVSLTVGHHYMDSWYRDGSNYANGLPYVAANELKPEQNRQIKAWIDQELSGHWFLHAGVFIGKFNQLMDFDWDYAIDHQFAEVRAMELGSYSYWGGTGSLTYKGERLSIGANVSLQGAGNTDLSDYSHQLYETTDGNHPLYLSPVTANLFLDWTPLRNFALSARFNTSGSIHNGGIDLTSTDFHAIYDAEPYLDTTGFSRLDVSLRLLNLLKRFELQLSLHNILDENARLPLIDGGYFLTRGREITLTLRGRL